MTAAQRPFDEALKSGHLTELLDYAGRRALAASNLIQLEEALALLRDVLPDPPADYSPRNYIASQEWVYASTMPENEHFYVMLKASTDWGSHLMMLRWIRVTGEIERFKGSKYRYRTVDGWRYWAMTDPGWTVLNRRRAPGAASVPLWEE